jgi:hypothetical protein
MQFGVPTSRRSDLKEPRNSSGGHRQRPGVGRSDFGHITVQEGVVSVVKEAMATLAALGAVVESVDTRLGHVG